MTKRKSNALPVGYVSHFVEAYNLLAFQPLCPSFSNNPLNSLCLPFFSAPTEAIRGETRGKRRKKVDTRDQIKGGNKRKRGIGVSVSCFCFLCLSFLFFSGFPGGSSSSVDFTYPLNNVHRLCFYADLRKLYQRYNQLCPKFFFLFVKAEDGLADASSIIFYTEILFGFGLRGEVDALLIHPFLF
jgi:hypothetical protein